MEEEEEEVVEEEEEEVVEEEEEEEEVNIPQRGANSSGLAYVSNAASISLQFSSAPLRAMSDQLRLATTEIS